MGLENFCREPRFSHLRNNMRTLVEVLASVVAGLPQQPQQQHYGFYRSGTITCCYHGVSSKHNVRKDEKVCVLSWSLLLFTIVCL